MKRLFITGSHGFLGARLKTFYENKYEVSEISHRELEYQSMEQVMKFFERKQPEIVVHCGAVSDTNICERNPKESYKANVTVTENIAKASRELGSKLVFCSSDQIYFGSQGMQMHREEEKVCPINEYGKQKFEAEQICHYYCEQSVCLRLSWMYDYRTYTQREHLDLYRNIMEAIQRKTKLCYPIYDFRGLTYVREIVENIEKTFQLPGGVYNFGAENDKNTYEIVKDLLTYLGEKEIEVLKNHQAFAKKPRNLCMDTGKIQNHGIVLLNTLDGLRRCVGDQGEVR